MSGRREKGRIVNGVLLLDKAIGISSNGALQEVKRLFNARKAGHTGSLDPLATGMLPICFGDATKFSQFLLDADKSYETTAKLGVITDSGDAEGEVIERRVIEDFSAEQLSDVLKKFRGDQLQIPSMFSAIKQKGRPLYELARQGIQVPREPRPITIFDLELIKATTDELALSVRCSKGTYIRSLVEDIGLALGCGAHVIALRRTAVANFTQEQMVRAERLKALFEKNDGELLNQFLLPVDTMLQAMPELKLTEQASFYLKKGQAVDIPETNLQGDVRLYDHDHTFIGVGTLQPNSRLQPKRLIAHFDLK